MGDAMTKAKHTPGPWQIVIDDDGNPLSGRPMVAAAPELDCAIVHWDGFVQSYWRSARGDKEIHANARLIAAAPDLLKALEELADLFDAMVSGEYRPDSYTTQPARAAIAKAKGET